MLKRNAISLLTAATLLAACGDRVQKTEKEPHSIALPTESVRTVAMPDIDSETGSVIADDRVDLSSRVAGFIRRLDVREGQRVRKGDVLVQIDPADVDEAIRQAQAGVTAAKADLADAERDRDAFSTGAGQGWVSADTLRKAQVRCDIGRAAVSKAESALAAARAQQAYTTISSPVDGVVVARNKRKGDMATPGGPILTIESREDLLFKLFVTESAVGRMRPGMAGEVHIDALPGKVLPGQVQRIVPSGDPVTRRYEVDLAFPVSPEILPGMFGRAEFSLGSTPVLVVPRQSITEHGGLQGVFVVDDRNVSRFRWLRLGREWNGLAEVTAGLSAGDRIVGRIGDGLADGTVILAEGQDDRAGHRE